MHRFDRVKDGLPGLTRAGLFKRLSEVALRVFIEEEIQAKHPAEDHERLTRAVADVCVETCGNALAKDFVKLVRLRSAQQDVVRDFVMLAVDYSKCNFPGLRQAITTHRHDHKAPTFGTRTIVLPALQTSHLLTPKHLAPNPTLACCLPCWLQTLSGCCSGTA